MVSMAYSYKGHNRRNALGVPFLFWSQSHQRFLARIFRTNFWCLVTFQLGAKNLYKKRVRKTLMKLTTGWHFFGQPCEL